MLGVRADASSQFGSNSPQVGYPRFGRENPFSPGGTLPGLNGSYLARLGRAQRPDDRHFGLGDHIGVSVPRLETLLTSSLTTTVEGLFSRTRSLKSAADTLVSGTANGVFDRRTAVTTDSAVSGKATSGATLTRYGVDVLQLAVAQQNTGTQLLSAFTPSDIATGTHTFQITAGATVTPVSVTILAADTNLQAMTRVRDAINAAAAGLDATITTTDDVSQLSVTSLQTGTTSAFSLVDDPGSSAIADTGIGTATRAAANAEVRVNGVDQTLQENKLALDASQEGGEARATLFFHDLTEETVRVDVTVALDAASVVAGAQRLVQAVNDVREFVADKPDILSRGLLSRLNVAVSDLRDALIAIGIEGGEAGLLSLDEPRLRSSLDQRPAEVERTIGSIQGLASRERSVAETILGDAPIAFATRPGPLGSSYGRFLADTARLHNYMLGGLFVDIFA